jgi:hypothetical protein
MILAVIFSGAVIACAIVIGAHVIANAIRP